MARSNSKSRSYVPFKWTKELIIFLSVLVVAIALTIICLIPTSKERFMNEWTEAIEAASGTAFDDEHVFEYISYNELEKARKNCTEEDPLFVLYGSCLDSTTVSNITEVNEMATEYEVDKIYILKCDFVMEADEDDAKDKAKLEKYRDALGLEKIDNLYTYCQLFVYTNSSEYDFNSQDIIDDSDNTDASFSKALKKCMSTYSPKAKDSEVLNK